jgi:hypothetical protein
MLGLPLSLRAKLQWEAIGWSLLQGCRAYLNPLLGLVSPTQQHLPCLDDTCWPQGGIKGGETSSYYLSFNPYTTTANADGVST